MPQVGKEEVVEAFSVLFAICSLFTMCVNQLGFFTYKRHHSTLEHIANLQNVVTRMGL